MITPAQATAGQGILKSAGFTPPVTPSSGGSSWYSAVQNATPTQAPSVQPKDDILNNPVTRGIEDVFPGKEIGDSLGTAAVEAGQLAGVVPGGVKGMEETSESQVSPEKLIGDYGQAALTAAAPEIGGEEGAAGRIAGNVALGAGLGGTNAMAQGKDTEDVAGEATGGAALGGGASVLGEGLSKLSSILPARLIKAALPKLANGTEADALQKIKIGSMSKMLSDSKNAVSSLGKQVQAVLTHPDYANETGQGNSAVQKTLDSFPNSNYTSDSILNEIKSLVPETGALVDKIGNGTATIGEKNDVRSSLDQATKSLYTKMSRPPASQAIGKSFADALRGEVQNAAPETKPIFEKLSQELNLRNALDSAKTKSDRKSAVGLYDIISGLGGLASAGPLGSLAAIGTEKLARSPEAQIGAAKGVQAISKAMPTVGRIARGVRAPIENAALGSQ